MIRLRSSHRRNRFARLVHAGVGLALVAGILVVWGGPASAASIVVTSAGDGSDLVPGDGACVTVTGDCSLRAAIQEANALPGADTITFSGVTLVEPAGALPTIGETLTIDGSVMSGPVSLPAVQIDGSSVPGTADGLTINAGMSEIRGLAISGFGGDGIVVRADDVNIVASFIGTDLSGTTAAGNGGAGIRAVDTTGLFVGGSLTDRTLVSANGRGIDVTGGGRSTITNVGVGTDITNEVDLGNRGDGIVVRSHATATILGNQVGGNDGVGILIEDADDATLNGNVVGVDPGGSILLPNAAGIEVRGGAGISERVVLFSNRVVGNLGVGIRIGDGPNAAADVGVPGATLRANLVGTIGSANLGNGGDGVLIGGGGATGGTIVGGSLADANRIAFNGGAGVHVLAGGTNERILSNAIFNNVGLGIDLDPTANDDQQSPQLTALTGTAPDVTVEGTLTGFALNHAYRVELFGNADCVTGAGEGRAFLRQRSVTTDGSGFATFAVPVAMGTWQAVTATATDDAGTSEFSGCLALGGHTTEADLSITKTAAGDPPFVGGGDLVYHLTAENTGPDAADGVTITDPLPAGTSFVGAVASQGSCGEDAGVVTCPLGGLASGGSATVDLTVALPDVAGDTTLTNTAGVTATTDDPDPADNAASTDVTVIARRVDLHVTKSAPADVTEGDAFDYVVTVSNAGPDAAHGVSLIDDLPAEVGFQHVTTDAGSCSHVGGEVSCDLGSLPSGGAATVTISVRAGGYAGGGTRSFANTAAATSDRPDQHPGDEQATANVMEHAAAADLRLSKTDGVETAHGGDDLTYTLTVHDDGPGDATGVTLTDPLPDGATFGSATASQGSCSEDGGVVTCSLGDLADGDAAAVTLVVTTAEVDEETTLTNSASVDADEADPDDANDAASDDTTLEPAGDADLSILSFDDAPDPVTGGYLVGYTVVIRNEGTSDAHDVVLTDALPAGTRFEAPTPNPLGCRASKGVVSCALGTIAAGASTSVLLVLDTPEVMKSVALSNAVAVSSPDDANPANDRDTELTSVSPRQAGSAAGFIPPNAGRRFVADGVTTWPGGWPIATSSDTTVAAAIAPSGPGGVLSILEGPCGGSFACRAARRAAPQGGTSPPAVLGNVVTFSPPPGATAGAPVTGFLYLDRSIVPGTSGLKIAFRDAQTGAFIANLPWCGRSGPAPACVVGVDRIYAWWFDRVHLDLRVKVRFLRAGSFAVMR
jgi:uncharacterized repeat protein (TIGR01451 family)/CSLREA domain-containing protein